MKDRCDWAQNTRFSLGRQDGPTIAAAWQRGTALRAAGGETAKPTFSIELEDLEFIGNNTSPTVDFIIYNVYLPKHLYLNPLGTLALQSRSGDSVCQVT